MSAARRHKRHHHEEHENHERWLVSGFDMMTLLFAVFVVLFAISSTNISKVKLLQQSLQEALSGPVFDGGRAMMSTGDDSSATEPAAPEPPLPTLSPIQAVEQTMRPRGDDAGDAAAEEEAEFQELKRRIDELVERAGLAEKVSTTVSPAGLRVRLLTDHLLFTSGSAELDPGALPALDGIAAVIADERDHPVRVEGHTDDQPIATSRYPSNWQLSGARAGAVVQRLAADGVAGARLSLAGYADEHPVASNGSAAGRAANRRVEIVLTRLHRIDPPKGGGHG
jgi:chemotaxis protein MotB